MEMDIIVKDIRMLVLTNLCRKHPLWQSGRHVFNVLIMNHFLEFFKESGIMSLEFEKTFDELYKFICPENLDLSKIDNITKEVIYSNMHQNLDIHMHILNNYIIYADCISITDDIERVPEIISMDFAFGRNKKIIVIDSITNHGYGDNVIIINDKDFIKNIFSDNIPYKDLLMINELSEIPEAPFKKVVENREQRRGNKSGNSYHDRSNTFIRNNKKHKNFKNTRRKV